LAFLFAFVGFFFDLLCCETLQKAHTNHHLEAPPSSEQSLATIGMKHDYYFDLLYSVIRPKQPQAWKHHVVGEAYMKQAEQRMDTFVNTYLL
jgi:hypothetical protein